MLQDAVNPDVADSPSSRLSLLRRPPHSALCRRHFTSSTFPAAPCQPFSLSIEPTRTFYKRAYNECSRHSVRTRSDRSVCSKNQNDSKTVTVEGGQNMIIAIRFKLHSKVSSFYHHLMVFDLLCIPSSWHYTCIFQFN